MPLEYSLLGGKLRYERSSKTALLDHKAAFEAYQKLFDAIDSLPKEAKAVSFGRFMTNCRKKQNSGDGDKANSQSSVDTDDAKVRKFARLNFVAMYGKWLSSQSSKFLAAEFYLNYPAITQDILEIRQSIIEDKTSSKNLKNFANALELKAFSIAESTPKEKSETEIFDYGIADLSLYSCRTEYVFAEINGDKKSFFLQTAFFHKDLQTKSALSGSREQLDDEMIDEISRIAGIDLRSIDVEGLYPLQIGLSATIHQIKSCCHNLFLRDCFLLGEDELTTFGVFNIFAPRIDYNPLSQSLKKMADNDLQFDPLQVIDDSAAELDETPFEIAFCPAIYREDVLEPGAEYGIFANEVKKEDLDLENRFVFFGDGRGCISAINAAIDAGISETKIWSSKDLENLHCLTPEILAKRSLRPIERDCKKILTVLLGEETDLAENFSEVELRRERSQPPEEKTTAAALKDSLKKAVGK